MDSDLFHREYSNFNKLCQTIDHWDLELYKLDKQPFHGEVLRIATPSLLYFKALFSCRMKQAGKAPAGYRTFALSSKSRQKLMWRGHSVDEKNLLIFPEGSELFAVNESNFEMMTLSIHKSLLQNIADTKKVPHLLGKIDSLEVLRGDTIQLARLRSYLHQCSRSGELVPETVIVYLLDIIIWGKKEIRTPEPSLLRYLTMQKVDRYILEHAEEAPTVETLCEVTAVSIRTMEYTIKQFYGMTPKRYIITIRLNLVYKELGMREYDSTRISAVANRYGFWHMGQFASDYKELFSEKPSDTLKKNITED